MLLNEIDLMLGSGLNTGFLLTMKGRDGHTLMFLSDCNVSYVVSVDGKFSSLEGSIF